MAVHIGTLLGPLEEFDRDHVLVMHVQAQLHLSIRSLAKLALHYILVDPS